MSVSGRRVAAAQPPRGGDGAPGGRGASRRLTTLLGSSLFAARFAPIWIGLAVLFVIAAIIAPETLSSASFNSAILPLSAFTAIAALGQMLVIMTGGIDLSMAGMITLIGSLLVGVSHSSNGRLGVAIAICLGWAALGGLANGILIAFGELNPLIVTLATGEIFYGITTQYRLGTGNASGVPASLSNWALERFLGVSWIFWVGVVLAVVVAVLLRYSARGRRFQSVGANQRAAWISGLRVRFYVLGAYVLCSMLGGVTAIMLSGLLVSPDTTLGGPYLLGPVAAVVLAGASLLGGLASTTSTWVAAFFLLSLDQMLRVLGLSSALQYVVYGLAIIVGMLISGDRIADVFGRFLARSGTRALLGDQLETEADEEAAAASGLDSLPRPAPLAGRSGATGVASAASTPDGRVPVLVLRGISKRFGAVQAVADVTIDCYAGEVHAVVGENGSGKSTLLGVACGVHEQDSGSVEIAGARLASASAADTMRLGLGMAYQTYSQVLDLTVAENLLLAAPPGERPRYRELNPWAAAKLAEFDVSIDPSVLAGSLSLAQRQFLEVVKALLSHPQVLLLDEPTTALGPGEVEKLHALIADRVAAGVGVVYVSHRLPEVLGLADRVTVLRDGVAQGTFDAAGLSEEALVALMIGRPLQLAFPESDHTVADEPLLEVSALRAERFGPIDLRVRPGEIIGLAGAEGNGQSQFIRSLAGVERAAGTVRRRGALVDLRAPHRALDAGIVLLSSDRVRESLFAVLGIRANATLQVLKRFTHLGWIARPTERRAVLTLARRLKIRAASVEQPVTFLSGGNQQKVSLMRPFLRDSLTVILADEPTQGVDVASRFDIYRALREKSAEGVAVIVKSSDPLELSGLCDRVLVMSRGQVIDEIPHEQLVPAAEVGERRIIEAIVGSGRQPAVGGEAPARTAAASPAVATHRPLRRGLRYRSWMSVTLIALLMVAVGVYTASRSSAFSSEFNLNGLFELVVILAIVSMGQLNAMLVGGFDVSVGSVMSFCIVLGSFTMSQGEPWWTLLLGTFAVVALGVVAGIINATLIRVGKLSPIIATLAMLSVFYGIALVLRPIAGGSIDSSAVNALQYSVGPVPIALIVVVAVAVLWDRWLYRSRGGLVMRAVGLDQTAARRTGAPVGRIFVRGFILSATLAGVAAVFLAAQLSTGDPNGGSDFALESVAAAVLGGAALTGGRGSFIGALIGSTFLFLVINILPFLNISEAYGQIAVGGLTLVALSIYNGATFTRRIRAAIADLRGVRLVPDQTLHTQ